MNLSKTSKTCVFSVISFLLSQLMIIINTSRMIKRLLDEKCLPPVRISLALSNETGHKRTHDKLEYTVRFEDDVTGTQQWNWTAGFVYGLHRVSTGYGIRDTSPVCLFTELVYWTSAMLTSAPQNKQRDSPDSAVACILGSHWLINLFASSLYLQT